MKYDVIVVGGGAAGSTLASRLAEDANTSVLLLEAGNDYPDVATLPDDVKFGGTRYAEAQDSIHNWALRGTITRGTGRDPRRPGQGDRRRVVHQRPGDAARVPRGLRRLGRPGQR